MKKTFLNILGIAFMLTSIAYVMDGDVVANSMQMRFAEFFGMMGIVTLIISIFYFSVNYFLRNNKKTV